MDWDPELEVRRLKGGPGFVDYDAACKNGAAKAEPDMMPVLKLSPSPPSKFVEGFDFGAEEEQRKRAMRAAKFGATRGYSDNPPDGAPNRDFFNVVNPSAVQDFGGSEAADEDVDHAEDPILPGNASEVRMDTIHLYGTDQMSTEDVKAYFAEYGPADVEWINDSACNVVFDDESTARRAIEGKTLPSYRQHPLVGEACWTTESMLQFRPGLPFTKGFPATMTNMTLKLRFAAYAIDMKTPGAWERSRYYMLHGLPPRSELGSDNLLDVRPGLKRKNCRQIDSCRPSILDRLGPVPGAAEDTYDGNVERTRPPRILSRLGDGGFAGNPVEFGKRRRRRVGRRSYVVEANDGGEQPIVLLPGDLSDMLRKGRRRGGLYSNWDDRDRGRSRSPSWNRSREGSPIGSRSRSRSP